MALDPTGIFSHNYRQHRGISWKEHVRCATTANITIATALNAGDTIDGVTLAAGNRVLVKNQSTPTQNGIYIAGATPIRAADMDQDITSAVIAEEIAGAFVYVAEGSANGGTLWHTTNADGDTIGSDDIVWAQFTGGSASAFIDLGNLGATETLDVATYDWLKGTVDSNVAITVSGFVAGEGRVILVQLVRPASPDPATNVVTWDSDITFDGDDQPDTAADSVTFFELWTAEGDTTIYGAKVGGGSMSFATPAIVLGTAAAAGAATTTIRSDSTIVAFDATVPVTQAFGDAAATGSAAVAARRDHVHGMPSSSGGIGEILISDTPSTPLVFADLIQNEAQDDLVYADP